MAQYCSRELRMEMNKNVATRNAEGTLRKKSEILRIRDKGSTMQDHVFVLLFLDDTDWNKDYTVQIMEKELIACSTTLRLGQKLRITNVIKYKMGALLVYRSQPNTSIEVVEESPSQVLPLSDAVDDAVLSAVDVVVSDNELSAAGVYNSASVILAHLPWGIGIPIFPVGSTITIYNLHRIDGVLMACSATSTLSNEPSLERVSLRAFPLRLLHEFNLNYKEYIWLIRQVLMVFQKQFVPQFLTMNTLLFGEGLISKILDTSKLFPRRRRRLVEEFVSCPHHPVLREPSLRPLPTFLCLDEIRREQGQQGSRVQRNRSDHFLVVVLSTDSTGKLVLKDQSGVVPCWFHRIQDVNVDSFNALLLINEYLTVTENNILSILVSKWEHVNKSTQTATGTVLRFKVVDKFFFPDVGFGRILSDSKKQIELRGSAIHWFPFFRRNYVYHVVCSFQSTPGDVVVTRIHAVDSFSHEPEQEVVLHLFRECYNYLNRWIDLRCRVGTRRDGAFQIHDAEGDCSWLQIRSSSLGPLPLLAGSRAALHRVRCTLTDQNKLVFICDFGTSLEEVDLSPTLSAGLLCDPGGHAEEAVLVADVIMVSKVSFADSNDKSTSTLGHERSASTTMSACVSCEGTLIVSDGSAHAVLLCNDQSMQSVLGAQEDEWLRVKRRFAGVEFRKHQNPREFEQMFDRAQLKRKMRFTCRPWRYRNELVDVTCRLGNEVLSFRRPGNRLFTCFRAEELQHADLLLDVLQLV